MGVKVSPCSSLSSSSSSSFLHGDQSQSGKSIKLTFLYASCLWSKINFFYSTTFDVFGVKISLV